MTDGPTTPTPERPSGLPGGHASLVERAKNILFSPKTEWPRIDAEPDTIGGIYTRYVIWLAAIGPIAMLIGQQLIGITVLGVNYKPALSYSLGTAVLTYVISLGVVYVIAMIIDALAPTFGGTKNQVKAFQVAAYASTAGWVAAIFNIIPMLGFLALIGSLYGLYLLYLGLPVLMKAPQDKAVGYTVVVVIVWIVVFFIVAAIVGALVASFFGVGALTGGTVRY